MKEEGWPLCRNASQLIGWVGSRESVGLLGVLYPQVLISAPASAERVAAMQPLVSAAAPNGCTRAEGN